ncbi:MAG: T9SS type A sorting domain-containing protein [Flavipsychrobacter sp.]|nr:T9SS type A sorting domain-containing protein [Flavipsychrobacter sp.]
MKTFNSISVTSLVLLLHFCPLVGTAQYAAVDSQSAADLVQYMTGLNVTVSNATLTCAPRESGIFNYGGTILPMSDGVVLATCLVEDIGLPAAVFASMGSGATPGDSTLDNALGNGAVTKDACIVECDVVADYDTLYLNYSFASEEYPEYACTQYNDAFGFFITGPGYPTYTNFALVPGTNIPSAINSINSAINPGPYCINMGTGSPFPQYYIDNQGMNGQDIVFDGMTDKIEAFIVVTTNVSYHLKFVVANVTDHGWQSGVFIEGGSLASRNASTTSVHNVAGNLPTLAVYPNPSTNHVSLAIPAAIAGMTAQIVVTDVIGKSVFTYSGAVEHINESLQTYSSQFAPGIYHLNLACENYHQVIKFQIN